MTLFADRQTDRHLLGVEIPASIFQSIQPGDDPDLRTSFSMMWTRLNESRHPP